MDVSASGSCRDVLEGGEVAVGPVGFVTQRRAQEAAEWQSRVRARVRPSRLPDTAQLRSRHLMGKGGRNKSGVLEGRSATAAPRQRPTVGPPPQSAGTFPRL